MKKAVVILTGLLFLMSAVSVYALNIASVDLDKITAQYKGLDKLKKKYEDEAKKENAKLEARSKAFTQKANDFDKQRSILDKKVLEQKTAELQAEYTQLEEDKYKFTKKLQSQNNELVTTVMAEIKAVAQKIAKEKGYDYVMPTLALLAGGEDITYLVLKKMNEE